MGKPGAFLRAGLAAATVGFAELVAVSGWWYGSGWFGAAGRVPDGVAGFEQCAEAVADGSV